MAKPTITALSKEQEITLESYRKKWQAIAISIKPIERQKAKAAIKEAYKTSNYSEPEIIFFGSPFAAIKKTIEIEDFKTYLGRDISYKFRKRVWKQLRHQIESQLDESFFYKFFDQISYPEYPNHLDCDNNVKSFYFPMGIESCVEEQILEDFDHLETYNLNVSEFLGALTRPPGWSSWGCLFDFCISELDLQHDRQKWQVMQQLMQYCDFIFQFENVCLVCDRPNRLSCDR